uniref:Uncharacterized protein n=1 Tax=Arundo donax TaxID=35708 RepID=A0A0A9H8J7_ARUDO
MLQASKVIYSIWEDMNSKLQSWPVAIGPHCNIQNYMDVMTSSHEMQHSVRAMKELP